MWNHLMLTLIVQGVMPETEAAEKVMAYFSPAALVVFMVALAVMINPSNVTTPCMQQLEMYRAGMMAHKGAMLLQYRGNDVTGIPIKICMLADLLSKQMLHLTKRYAQDKARCHVNKDNL